MALFVNKVSLAGNLTRDPQVRFLTDERAVCNFGLAINRRYRTQSGEQREETTFVDVEAWGKTAELVGRYLGKGRNCLVEGALKLDQWEKDGQKRSQLKVVAQQVHFVDGPADAAGSGAGSGDSAVSDQAVSDQGGDTAARSSAPAPGADLDDEPPF
jgi:single-strand DNA-binding protein